MKTNLVCLAIILSATSSSDAQSSESPTPISASSAIRSDDGQEFESLPFSQTTSGMYLLNSQGTIFSLRHFAGEGVGNRDSFSTFELFQPFSQSSSSTWFLDGRFVLQNDRSTGGNLGFGYRYLDTERNRLWGASVWYDVDDTHRSTFQQIGISLESLGEWLDIRSNIYLPVDDTEETFGFSTGTGRFVGTSFIIDRNRFEEVAMTGVELEAGIPVPMLENPNVRVYAGYYYFDGNRGTDLHGVSSRLVGYVRPNIAVQVELTHDRIFDTNVVFGVSLFLDGASHERAGGRPYHSIRAQNADYDDSYAQVGNALRLYDTVRRNYNVVVADRIVPEAVMATNAATGLALQILHIDSAAAAGGDGSEATPFNTLLDAQNNAVAGDLLFVRTGSTFTNESITLLDSQRLLGEAIGIDHVIATAQGSVLLPQTGAIQPIIMPGAGNTAVDISGTTGVEVSGLTLDGGARGIAGDLPNGAVDANINRMIIQNMTGNGIDIRPSTRTTIDQVTFDNIAGTNIFLNPTSSATISNVTINNPTGLGLSLQNATGTTTIDNFVYNGGANGTGAMFFDNPSGTLNVSNTTLTGGNAGASGVNILNGDGTFTFDSNTSITDTGSSAFNVNGGTTTITYNGDITQTNNTATIFISGNHAGAITFQNGTIAATNGSGLQFFDADGTYVFNGTTTLNGGDAGIDIQNASTGTFTFGANTSITNPAGNAFDVNGGTPVITYSGTITNNAGRAMLIRNLAAGSSVDFDSTLLNAINDTGTGIRLNNINGDITIGNPNATINVSLTGTTGIDVNSAVATGNFVFNSIGIDLLNADRGIDYEGGGGSLTINDTSIDLNGFAGSIGIQIDNKVAGAINLFGTGNTVVNAITPTFSIISSGGTWNPAANGIEINGGADDLP